MKKRNVILAVSVMLLMLTTLSFGHLPSLNDASLRMGRIGAGGAGRSRADAADTFTNTGAWSPTTTYRGDYTIRRGDTVSHGTFNGKQLWWWAKFYAQGDEFEPGFFAPQGGTSPWVLVNSLSASQNGGTQNYVWKGWNGDMESMSGLSADIPTWRDGAEGAYSFTHDDIGAMPFDLGIQPAWDLAQDFPDIKTCWGVYVEKMSGLDWELARSMVVEGHEMFNHSMEHTSAADQWQWFFPGQVIPSHDPAIPEALRGLEVIGTWGNPDKGPVYPYVGDGTRIFESPMVAIRSTHYWSQNAPTTESVGKDLGAPYGVVIEPEIYLKPGVEEIVLETGQKQYVKYDVYDSSAEPSHTGQIAATGRTWLEMEQLDKYGGQFWLPAKPYYPYTPIGWTWGEEWKFVPGQVISYEGSYYTVNATPDGHTAGFPTEDAVKYTPYPEYDPSNPAASISSQGSYVGSNWSSTTEDTTEKWSVAVDRGVPGFVAKVWCVKKWTDPEYKLNIQDANDSINKYIYEPIVTAAHHFKKGKRSEYYGYPFDAYSEVTHDSLEQAGFVGARGGAKSGQPIPGDFFHPYRIDFDAFYITDPSYTESSSDTIHIYPNNPHVLLGMNEMVDSIISQKGYMIREFHAVPDIAAGAWYSTAPSEQWPVNSAAQGQGGWWGGVPVYMLRAHYEYLEQKINNHELTVYTVGEVTKYRMTANASSNAQITASGENYNLSVQTNETILEKYRDEISVIVSLSTPADSFNAYYQSPDANWGDTPRRRPKMMDDAGLKWSVSIQPYLGTLVLEPNAAWGGPGVVLDSGVTSVKGPLTNKATEISYNGIRSGHVSLKLPSGSYSAKIFNAQGRVVKTANISSHGGIVQTGLRTSSLSSGLYFLQVQKEGVAVLRDRILIK